MRKVIRAIEETTINIVENTTSLTTATHETTQSINDMVKTVEELAQASMRQTKDAENVHSLSEKSQSIGSILNAIMGISEQTGHATKSIEDILNAIQFEVGTTKESIDESAATMETISNNTGNLANTIEKLDQLDNRFKL